MEKFNRKFENKISVLFALESNSSALNLERKHIQFQICIF